MRLPSWSTACVLALVTLAGCGGDNHMPTAATTPAGSFDRGGDPAGLGPQMNAPYDANVIGDFTGLTPPRG